MVYVADIYYRSWKVSRDLKGAKMELKQDDIVKALECCTTKNGNVKNCGECPLKDEQCTVALPQNALLLFKEFTEGIKARDDIISRFIETMPLVKADTVRKMQEKILKVCKPLNEVGVGFLETVLEDIAEEIIGETKQRI